MKRLPSSRSSGAALVLTIMTLAMLMVVVGIAMEYTNNIGRNVQRTNALESAIEVGDGAISMLFANWRQTCRTTGGAPTTTALSGIALPNASPAGFPSISGLSATTTDYYSSGNKPPSVPNISNYKVKALNVDWTPVASSTATPAPSLGQSRGGTLATTDCAYSYLASADVTLPAISGNLVAKVRRIFQRKQESPWNYAIFYVDPLELHPSLTSTMHVTGWVHTNSDLWTGHSTLWFDDKVTFGNNWNIAFMSGDGQHPETPTAPNWTSGLPPARDIEHEPFGADANTFNFNTGDTNPNNDGYHELIEPPNTDKNGNYVSGYSDPLSAYRYFNQADIIITVDGSNTVRIYQPDGSGGVTPITSGADYNTIKAAVTTNQTIQDNREGTSIRLATLDVGALTKSSGTKWKPGLINQGIIYLYDTSATSSTRRGFRVTNGDIIPTGGLTVVSPNPVYIQGDYNTGSGTIPSNLAGASNDPTKPQVTGYTRQPCSVIADAVSILSNAWLDTNSTAAVGSRDATNTTINAAIISGIVPTNAYGDGAYSGGAENFPRFLEDWSSATLTYYGSMVELYKSQQSVGEWGRDNVYSPPTRHWYFDTNFRLNPPPGTLMIVSYVQSRWWVAP